MDQHSPKYDFLPKHGEMSELVRQKDWSATALGPIEQWPQSLRTTVSLCLASNFPINIIWGPQAIQIYNDGYRDVCGEAHPRALGESYKVTWASAWPAIGKPFSEALEDRTSFLENQRMFLTRNGYLEETFFTFSLSAVRDEAGAVGGLFHPVTETTPTIVAARRTHALRELTAAMGVAETAAELVEVASQTLSSFAFDLPFMVFFGFDEALQTYRRQGFYGIADAALAAPPELAIDATAPWPMARARNGGPVQLCDVDNLADCRCGPYPEPPHDVFLMPVCAQGADQAPLFIVAGASPRLPMDESYRGFFDLLNAAFAAALATVRARENERKRLAALAAIDRAKTAFFSNVSHEFRTPLTLLLGPLEDIKGAEGLPARLRENAEVAYRNGLRLMKLVNGILDFSRIEAGRVQTRFEPVDVSAYSAELAANFRSATDKAGLALLVDTPGLSGPVYLDRGMWETVLLNLLSNAFKFTLQGSITVSVREAADGRGVEVAVSDTGTGIPQAALARLFERFYRAENAGGRSFEGSGIGLSLVKELVALHGGQVAVESLPGRGTTFTVWLPYGTGHLPAGWQLAEAGAAPNKSDAFVGEAVRWLPDVPDATEASAGNQTEPRSATGPAWVLLADDNSDMRNYLRRLLEEAGYAVDAVADGEQALSALRSRKPELVISDVMMPRLNGFELLARVRADAELKDISFILLSARAGQEARVEGMQAGADDYLVKPFSAKALVARVDSIVALARQRQQASRAASQVQLAAMADRLEQQVIEQSRERGKTWQLSADLLAVLDSDGRLGSVNPAWERVLGWRAQDLAGRVFLDFVHADDRAETEARWRQALQGQPIAQFENRNLCANGESCWISWVAVLEDGRLYCSGRDVSREHRRAEELALAKDSLRHAQKMEAVGQLTGGVAHDFNNLLTVIRGSVELLKRPNLPEEKRTRYIEAIANTVTRAAKLTGQLLAFARRQALKPQVFDACKTTGHLDEMLATVAGAHVRLTIGVHECPLFVNADPTQLDSALVNVAVNARDAMPNGGALQISVREVNGLPESRRRAARPGAFVAISLTDTGTGIPEDSLEKIFEPFFTTKPPGHGTGLGLSQVYGFAKQSGGEVDVESVPGQGSTFTIYLPKVDAPAVTISPVASVSQGISDGDGRRVLVVEDNQDIGPFVARALEEAGFRVVLETNGAAALVRLASGQVFDIVFSDVVMPGMSGLELGAEVRLKYPGLPVLLASGYSHVMAQTGTQGFELLDKPYSVEELTRMLCSRAQKPGVEPAGL